MSSVDLHLDGTAKALATRKLCREGNFSGSQRQSCLALLSLVDRSYPRFQFVRSARMTRWAVIFRDEPEMLEVRADKTRRDAHVAYVISHPELLIGGGLRPDTEADFCGALWIVEAANQEDVVALVRADPFFVEGYRQFEVFVWGKILEDQTVTL